MVAAAKVAVVATSALARPQRNIIKLLLASPKHTASLDLSEPFGVIGG